MKNTPVVYALFEKADPAPASKPSADDIARAELASTRMLISEEMFDSLLALLVDTGLVPKKSAAIMLDTLSAKLMMHSCGLTLTTWAIREKELLHQATRIAMKAERMRVGVLRS